MPIHMKIRITRFALAIGVCALAGCGTYAEVSEKRPRFLPKPVGRGVLVNAEAEIAKQLGQRPRQRLDRTHRWVADQSAAPDCQARLLRLLEALPHTVHRFESVADLQQKYSAGGLIISPRFLDHPYNPGHSEWKLTLGMACGLPALGSPVPSYLDVAERAAPGAIRVCETLDDWEAGLRQCLAGDWPWAAARVAARRVVEEHYSTPVVSGMHLEFVRKCLADKDSTFSRSGDAAGRM